jgi:hypothetical protein
MTNLVTCTVAASFTYRFVVRKGPSGGKKGKGKGAKGKGKKK